MQVEFVDLQWASLFMWSGIALYLTKPMIRAFTHKRRSLDLIWAVAWALIVNRAGFTVTSLFLGRVLWALVTCYVFSIGAGLAYFYVIRQYRKSDIA